MPPAPCPLLPAPSSPLLLLRRRLSVLLLVWLFLAVASPLAAQSPRQVLALTYDGPVTPAMLAYLQRGLSQAEAMGAEAVIFSLDTPGGSVDLTRQISQAIQRSPTPVIVYVAPARAWAASAGTLITLSGHLAAMAPETFIGAASPVGSGGEDLPETAAQKAKEALAATARSLAERRGPDAVAWAAETVLSAQAATAEEALTIGAIDVIAVDIPDLLAQLDGYTVIVQDQPRQVALADAEVVAFERSWIEDFLAALSNPAVAAILLTLGLNAILYELSSPGGYVAGAVGAICLLLAFYALGTLDANFAGLAFIGLAFILFLIDLKVGTGGVLTAGGLVAFVLGAAMLFDTPYAAIPWSTILGLAAAMGLFVAVALRAVVRTQRSAPFSGGDALVGAAAHTRTPLTPEGMVYVMGALWLATAEEGEIPAGEGVVITRRQGHRLWVRARA